MTAGFDERMAALRERFLERAASDRVALAAAGEAGDFAAIRDLAHRLAGVAGTLGFPEISVLARALEDAGGAEIAPALDRLLTSIDRLR